LQKFLKVHWGKINEEIQSAKPVIVYLNKIEGLK